MKRCAFHLFAILFIAAFVNAQQGPPASPPTGTTDVKKDLDQQRQAKAKERRGVIRGRVVADDNRPLAHIGVNIFFLGQQGNTRNIGTDEEGNFEADDLQPGSYTISTYVPGYVRRQEPGEPTVYRIGDSVTLNMVQGGVITGMVKNAAGEPVINVGVRVVRVRDGEGRPVRGSASGQDRRTDDRGVYRIYGLQPGAYVVLAGGSQSSVYGYNPYLDDAPTYYPSATRGTAVEVMVQNGQEASGIDIAYRGDKGHAISGTVAGLPAEAGNAMISVRVMQATTGVFETGANIPPGVTKKAFAVSGLTDGDYLIQAESNVWPDEKRYFAAPVRRVTIKGTDVTGVDLSLAPLASVSGRIVLESATGADSRTKCQTSRPATIEEVLISLRRDNRGEAAEQRWLPSGTQTALGERGEFAIYRLSAGTYRPSFVLPSEAWYVKSETISEAARGNQPNARSAQPSDVATKGLAVRAGEQLAGLTMTIAEGAASVRGVVKPAKEKEALPPRLRLYLVPAEKEAAAEVLRYYQAEAQFDGAFAFTNLAPGRYWALSKAVSDEEWKDAALPPYWSAEGRAALRKEAEAANNVIDLSPCRKLSDYELRHGAPAAAVTPAVKK